MDSDNEVQAGEYRREPGDEDTDYGCGDAALRELTAVGGVESPARVDAAAQHRVHNEQTAHGEDIPAREVEPGEGQITGPDHQWHEEIAQHGRNSRYQEEEHHYDAVHREQLVVSACLNEIALGSEELEPYDSRKEPANKKEKGY